jgi:hypothetical protein
MLALLIEFRLRAFVLALVLTSVPAVAFAQEPLLPARPLSAALALYADTAQIGIDTRVEVPRAPDAAPSRALIVPLYATFAGLQALDAHSTLRAVKAGAVEQNPLMQWAAGSPGAMIAVKSAAAVGTIYLVEKGWKKNPVRTVVLMAVLNAAYAGIAVNNYRIANSLR